MRDIMNFVKTVIDNWDPINLLSHAPDDEYHSEIEEIDNLLCSTDNVIALSEGIYKVFLDAFGEDIFKQSKAECIRIAQLLLYQKRKVK